MAHRGARVVVNDYGVGFATSSQPSHEAADRVVQTIRDAGGEAVASYETVSTVEGGERIVQTALETWGRVDAVIANAGIVRRRPFGDMTAADFEAMLDVHLRGAFHVISPAYRYMMSHGGGRIVVMTSSTGIFGTAGHAHYGAAKMGQVGLIRTLAQEGAQYGIVANAIAPAAVPESSRSDLASESRGQQILASMTPERVTSLAVRLCHNSCPSSGGVFIAQGQFYGRVHIAPTHGWVSGAAPTPEDLDDHWDEIDSRGSKSEFDNPDADAGSWATRLYDEVISRRPHET